MLLLLTFSSFSLQAQSKKELENRRAKLLEEIRFTERLLSNTKKDVKSNLNDLAALKRKISLRERLIRNLKQENQLILNNIKKNNAAIEELKEQLEQLRKNYSESVVQSYRYQKSGNQILFILGAEDFNQGLRRLNYVRKISQKRKEQAKGIKTAQAQLEEKIEALEKMKVEKEALLIENKVQLSALDKEKQIVNSALAELRKEEKQYKQTINAKNNERAKLAKQIQKIIEEEIARAEAKKKSDLNNTPDPVIAKLSKDFYANKGKLPWPVAKGYISRGYGEYPHPELKNIKVNNTGIDIRTSENAAVRSVFKGEVVTVMSNPTFKNAVIIKHGNYFSVYTGLGKVSVSKGMKVDTKQVIGSAYSDDSGVTEIHLEIWKGKLKTNPAGWIYKH